MFVYDKIILTLQSPDIRSFGLMAHTQAWENSSLLKAVCTGSSRARTGGGSCSVPCLIKRCSVHGMNLKSPDLKL